MKTFKVGNYDGPQNLSICEGQNNFDKQETAEVSQIHQLQGCHKTVFWVTTMRQIMTQIVNDILSAFLKLRMSIEIYFLFSHLNHFPDRFRFGTS